MRDPSAFRGIGARVRSAVGNTAVALALSFASAAIRWAIRANNFPAGGENQIYLCNVQPFQLAANDFIFT